MKNFILSLFYLIDFYLNSSMLYDAIPLFNIFLFTRLIQIMRRRNINLAAIKFVHYTELHKATLPYMASRRRYFWTLFNYRARQCCTFDTFWYFRFLTKRLHQNLVQASYRFFFMSFYHGKRILFGLAHLFAYRPLRRTCCLFILCPVIYIIKLCYKIIAFLIIGWWMHTGPEFIVASSKVCYVVLSVVERISLLCFKVARRYLWALILFWAKELVFLCCLVAFICVILACKITVFLVIRIILMKIVIPLVIIIILFIVEDLFFNSLAAILMVYEINQFWNRWIKQHPWGHAVRFRSRFARAGAHDLYEILWDRHNFHISKDIESAVGLFWVDNPYWPYVSSFPYRDEVEIELEQEVNPELIDGEWVDAKKDIQYFLSHYVHTKYGLFYPLARSTLMFGLQVFNIKHQCKWPDYRGFHIPEVHPVIIYDQNIRLQYAFGAIWRVALFPRCPIQEEDEEEYIVRDQEIDDEDGEIYDAEYEGVPRTQWNMVDPVDYRYKDSLRYTRNPIKRFLIRYWWD